MINTGRWPTLLPGDRTLCIRRYDADMSTGLIGGGTAARSPLTLAAAVIALIAAVLACYLPTPGDYWISYDNPQMIGLEPRIRALTLEGSARTAALKTLVWVAQGRLAESMGWVRERGLAVDDDLSYLREFEHITLARVLIARHRSDRQERSFHEAVGLLERLLEAAEEGERTGSVIEILVLQALAHEAEGDTSLALAPLERALTLAEPEGYVRIFVDEGPPMATLLREAAKHGIAASNYVSQLLRAFGKAEGITPVTQRLIEPLSERELEVLRLLGTELDGPEIARELVVALSTIRTHTRNIYSKLGVNSRRAAVDQAEELDLL